MSLNKFKTKSYCVGGRHYSATDNIHGKVDVNGRKYLNGKCSIDRKNKTMYVNDHTIQAEGLGKFFKKMGKNIAKNPGKAIDLGVNFAQAAATRNPALITQSVMNVGKFLTKGNGLYLHRK